MARPLARTDSETIVGLEVPHGTRPYDITPKSDPPLPSAAFLANKNLDTPHHLTHQLPPKTLLQELTPRTTNLVQDTFVENAAPTPHAETSQVLPLPSHPHGAHDTRGINLPEARNSAPVDRNPGHERGRTVQRQPRAPRLSRSSERRLAAQFTGLSIQCTSECDSDATLTPGSPSKGTTEGSLTECEVDSSRPDSPNAGSPLSLTSLSSISLSESDLAPIEYSDADFISDSEPHAQSSNRSSRRISTFSTSHFRYIHYSQSSIRQRMLRSRNQVKSTRRNSHNCFSSKRRTPVRMAQYRGRWLLADHPSTM